jgi:hypothetical protein
MYAVVRANNRSCVAIGLALVRPSRLSRNPMREF